LPKSPGAGSESNSGLIKAATGYPAPHFQLAASAIFTKSLRFTMPTRLIPNAQD
jgi:hypothetical protein